MLSRSWGCESARGHLVCTISQRTGAQGSRGKRRRRDGQELSNPLSDVWALFTRFDANFADGDVNQGDAKVGGRMLFQPILPVPLHGTGANRWNLIATAHHPGAVQ